MSKINILIADDHKLIRETWSYILNSDARFQVIATCVSGEEGVEQAQRLRPNIVIMDNNMPGISGIQATAMIRKSVPETKVLGFSLHNEPVYAEKFLAAGAADYIDKTTSIEKMTQTLLRIHYNHGRSQRRSEMR